MEKEITYEEAMAQVEQIVKQVENNELGLEELSGKLKTALELVKTCKEKLTKTDQEIQTLLQQK